MTSTQGHLAHTPGPSSSRTQTHNRSTTRAAALSLALPTVGRPGPEASCTGNLTWGWGAHLPALVPHALNMSLSTRAVQGASEKSKHLKGTAGETEEFFLWLMEELQHRYARHSAKSFPWIILFEPHNTPQRHFYHSHFTKRVPYPRAFN